MAGVVGFEPTDGGIKTRCLNHLATPQLRGCVGSIQHRGFRERYNLN